MCPLCHHSRDGAGGMGEGDVAIWGEVGPEWHGRARELSCVSETEAEVSEKGSQ